LRFVKEDSVVRARGYSQYPVRQSVVVAALVDRLAGILKTAKVLDRGYGAASLTDRRISRKPED
jgi:hypothetical protein